MRLWSLHPKYLDRIGLVALWRESLLAQKVLQGLTIGYVNHPQLTRFKTDSDPVGVVGRYLAEVWDEACRRGYNFNRDKIERETAGAPVGINSGQLEHEFALLSARLKKRSPDKYREIKSVRKVECHPVFTIVRGPVEEWEKLAAPPPNG